MNLANKLLSKLTNRVLRIFRINLQHACPICHIMMKEVAKDSYECDNVIEHRKYIGYISTRSQGGKEE